MLTSYKAMADSGRVLNEYAALLAQAITAQDGASLARLLSFSGNETYCRYVAEALDSGKDVKKVARKLQPWNLEGMLQSRLSSMQAYYHQRFADAFTELQNAANLFLQEFRNWESVWAMSALHAIVFDIRTVAEKADSITSTGVRPRECLKEAGSFLMKAFGAIAGKGPKRIGALYVACQLFKVYFKLGTVHLCRSIIRVIDAGSFDDFPACDKVTYKYYTGRLDVYNDEFSLADEKLTYALEHCQRSKTGNIRRILRYLVPVRLSLGVVPTNALLTKFDLPEYVEVVQALRSGDVRMLRETLQRHEERFLCSGVFLVIEQLELQVYRRLIKKMHLLQKAKDPARAHQLRMDSIVRALRWLNVEVDAEEVECIAAVLIHKNLIRGYFSHKSKVVVLSKQDPFPKLARTS